MKYRKSDLDDCKAIYSLICELENRELPYERFCTIYRKQLSDCNYYCLVCEQDDIVIGVLNIRFESQLHHAEHIAEILEFAVSNTCRSKGIGKELFSQSCEIAKDNGCSHIEVACNQIRKNTHRFYMREGMHNLHFKFSKRLFEDSI
ncbi:GNAT family N-acetyltransferase [Clostridium boliviensis]|uniref:GNAT family N-acetyltransferase n=1 Tax=Clostridium boliviensis TaxID=318465 RepID=A0ABU4GH21_9CLOT|nr:GNAT family N-acetyltransferase [Clostridium boliviensis]MDW2796898.1 GNAT family N-acetyltransferase [Clostridium boliviensis]